jgi:hypothetical protein
MARRVGWLDAHGQVGCDRCLGHPDIHGRLARWDGRLTQERRMRDHGDGPHGEADGLAVDRVHGADGARHDGGGAGPRDEGSEATG